MNMVLPRSWLGIFLRGCIMGAADLVPGVSGGTLALITGIYERLIGAIASIDITALRIFFKGDIKGAWLHIDGNFLLVLACGILTSIFTLAHLIEYLVQTQPVLVWSFFSGLIIASILYLLRIVRPGSLSAFGFLLVGALWALSLSQLRTAELPITTLFIFFGGFIAISAMLLPGISGSFLLLMLGLYQPTLEAVTSFNMVYISVFGLGAATGFVVFSRIIRYLLRHFYERTLLFLTGLLIGSLYTTWPWKSFVESGVAPNIWPSTYAQSGASSQIGLALICLLLGFILVVAISAAGFKKDATTQIQS
jgi:putative membrane protein